MTLRLNGEAREERDYAAGLTIGHRIVDNLPGATSFLSTDHKRRYYAPGFKLGGYEAGVSALNTYGPTQAKLEPESIHQQSRNSCNKMEKGKETDREDHCCI